MFVYVEVQVPVVSKGFFEFQCISDVPSGLLGPDTLVAYVHFLSSLWELLIAMITRKLYVIHLI